MDPAMRRLLPEKEFKKQGSPPCTLWLSGRASLTSFVWTLILPTTSKGERKG